MRPLIKTIIDHPLFGKVVIALIILNAAVLGMETYPFMNGLFGATLYLIDQLVLWFFVVELSMQFIARGSISFRDPWYVFDCLVVIIAFLPEAAGLSVLRAARILRVLRLISTFPSLRRVVQSLIKALPGVGSIAGILLIVFYVFAVMATKLYGEQHPEFFGTLHHSLFSLFQIMTLEGWPDIVRGVLQTHPYAWIFFIIYILIATFTVLNFFIAIIVDSLQKEHMAEEEAEMAILQQIQRDVAALTEKIDQLK